ncbi:1,4-dihydroxy-2-naphthoate polyprenyltransferase [Halomicroarcula sp. F13]|uniref:1,4-dihydroxy-2-naphthoate octaprenyltransferase n=1 Tax=Haloarcula rubra TaxID=2487747 RepID=A0AAW4PXI0_9EURY|nr:1,4-dihydroxy-2-naphthoate polyprenyltransferase [Halomicroarcula rubra]MBX0325280.1 1,4-dihydroxy-2-naphthoate polyprenyltransferase [Halomicroarcula rubra]
MDNQHSVARLRAWLMAIRPQTLPAGASPVIVGVGLAIHDGVFAVGPAVAALLGALFLQIGSNFTNDYYDAIRGADTEDREGFQRVTQSGLISPKRVQGAIYVSFSLAALVGIYLVYIGGVPIIAVGLLSILAGFAYTGGPYPFGYHGLGDLFVFIFFGLVAVTGTYYVQAVSTVATVGPIPISIPAGTVPVAAVVASLPAAALSTNILVVNNIRDLETDRETGKRTLAVKIGYQWSRIEYTALLALSYLVPLVFAVCWQSVFPLTPLLTTPLAWRLWMTIREETTGEALNPALERTGKLLLAFSFLFAFGLATPSLI